MSVGIWSFIIVNPGIVSVNLGYNLNQKLALEKKKDLVVDKKQKALAFKNEHGKFPFFYNEKGTEAEIVRLEAQLDAIEKEFLSGKTDKFCGIAFVTFMTEEEKQACLNSHYKSLRRRIYNFFIDHFKKALKKIDKTELFFYDQRLTIFEAPEPSDVYWENLHFSGVEVMVRVTIAESISFFCLGCFGVGIYYLSEYQASINNSNQSSDDSESIKVKVIGALISVCISGVIEILKILIPMFAK